MITYNICLYYKKLSTFLTYSFTSILNPNNIVIYYSVIKTNT